MATIRNLNKLLKDNLLLYSMELYNDNNRLFRVKKIIYKPEEKDRGNFYFLFDSGGYENIEEGLLWYVSKDYWVRYLEGIINQKIKDNKKVFYGSHCKFATEWTINDF